MEQGKLYKKPVLTVMILINLGLSVLVVFLMRHVQTLLHEDVRVNLTEIVSQNKDAINSRLLLNLQNLDVTSERLTQLLRAVDNPDFGAIQAELALYAREHRGQTLFVANKNGTAQTDDGPVMDVSGRSYFRLAVEGMPNISGRVLSRKTGDEVFVLSVPLHKGSEIIGTLQKIYSVDDMHRICALSLFSDQGYMYLINRAGDTVLHTVHEHCHQETDNYFSDIEMQGNTEAARQLRRDIAEGKSGFIETRLGSGTVFSAYTPIEDLHDWYLITSVPTDAVAANANVVIRLFYVVLFVIAFIFSSFIALFMWYQNRQRLNLERIAFVDMVTGGSTYNKFLVDAAHTLEKIPAKRFSILKFDIDNFKYINKSYGFEFGDGILQYIERSLRNRLLPDEVLARISSDHFVMLLEDADEARVNKLLSGMENAEVLLSFSAGLYHIGDRSESINLMVDKASSAAQSVKGALNRRVASYSADFEKETLRNEELKRAVRQGLAQKEFVPFYQPKVNVLSGELVGGEALVRWRTPDGNYVSPGEFIPMCEQTGLIVEIDMLVYEQVLRFQRDMLDKGVEGVPISVNFSRLHLLDKDFLTKIVRLLHTYDVPPYLIEIELTESALFDNLDLIYDFTRKLRSHGLLIAMDDFGTGYSSMTMLREIPIDILKVDKGFLAETTDNNRRDIIFAAIADMARKLRITVVVEGVESHEDVELMTSCGCQIAQGYFFARPMKEEAFALIVDPPGGER